MHRLITYLSVATTALIKPLPHVEQQIAVQSAVPTQRFRLRMPDERFVFGCVTVRVAADDHIAALQALDRQVHRRSVQPARRKRRQYRSDAYQELY